MAMAERASLVNPFLHLIVSRGGHHDHSAVDPNSPIGAMGGHLGDVYVLYSRGLGSSRVATSDSCMRSVVGCHECNRLGASEGGR